MLPDPQEIKTGLSDLYTAIRCGWKEMRIVRLEQKLAKKRKKVAELRSVA